MFIGSQSTSQSAESGSRCHDPGRRAHSLSCTAREAGDFRSIENPARRIRLAPVLHAPSRDIEIPPSVTTRRSAGIPGRTDGA
jgi:hypothetical protein